MFFWFWCSISPWSPCLAEYYFLLWYKFSHFHGSCISNCGLFFEGGEGLHHLMIKCTDVWGHVRCLGIFAPNMSDSSELWNEGILWYCLICHLFWNPHISPLTWLWLGDPSILNMFDYGQPPPTTCTCEPWHASYAITCMSWLTPLLLHLW